MLGTSDSAAPAPRRKASKAESDEQQGLIEQLVPLGALLLVMGGATLIADPYKPCGPNQAEATAIIYPIIKRAVRELDARKKLSEGTQDAIAILLAMGAYGVRAHGTYQQIRAQEVERERANNSPNPTTDAHRFSGGFAGAATVSSAADPARDAGPHHGAPVAFAADARGGRRHADGGPRGAGGSGDERRANALLDELLAQDAHGRKRLGIG
jgi:hypothetical protein